MRGHVHVKFDILMSTFYVNFTKHVKFLDENRRESLVFEVYSLKKIACGAYLLTKNTIILLFMFEKIAPEGREFFLGVPQES